MTLMRLNLVTDATVEPVTTQEFMDFARVDVDPGGTLFTGLIKTARRKVEKETGLALINQSWLGVMDNWPRSKSPNDGWWDGVRDGPISLVSSSAEPIEVIKRPFNSLTSVAYFDSAGVLTTVAPTVYHYDISGYTCRIKLNISQVWPPIVYPRVGAVQIAFVAGFGPDATTVPDDLKEAVLMLAAHWHETREPGVEQGRAMVPWHVGALLDPWKGLRVR